MTCRCEDGIGAVAVAALEEVAAEASVALEVADDGFDRRASAQLAFDLSVDASFLA